MGFFPPRSGWGFAECPLAPDGGRTSQRRPRQQQETGLDPSTHSKSCEFAAFYPPSPQAAPLPPNAPESPPLPPAVLSEAPPLPPAPPIPAHVRASITQLRSAGVFLPGLKCGCRRDPALSVMAVPKRKAPGGQDSTASPAGAAKRARTEELTGVRFKAQLRDPQGAGQGECRAGPGRGPRACEAASGSGFGRGFRVPDTAPPFGQRGSASLPD